jgi:hypothetical protein
MNTIFQLLLKSVNLFIKNKIMKTKITNSWTSKKKQFDVIDISVRLSKITVFELFLDISKKHFKLTLLNFSLELI